MTNEKFEYKSGDKHLRYWNNSGPLDDSTINGLKCVWKCKVLDSAYGYGRHELLFSWKFDWNELKKKGIDRLSGYIHVKPSDKYSVREDCDEFSSRQFNVDLTESNQEIRCEIETTDEYLHFFVFFEYSLIPHYAKIEEESPSVQNETVSVIEEKKNNDANGKVNSDEMVSTTEQKDGIPEKKEDNKANVNEEIHSEELVPSFEQNDNAPVKDEEEKIQDNEWNLLSQLDKMFLSSEQNDAILVIDGKKIHVNKWFLSFFSEHFHNLFSMNDNDGKVNEFPIQGISVDDFKLVLGPISPEPVFPTDKTVEKLLELADRFKMSSVIAHCEHHLLYMSKIENEKKMWIGEQYGMKKVLAKAILEMDTIEKAKKWKQSPEYKDFSYETKIRVLEKFI